MSQLNHGILPVEVTIFGTGKQDDERWFRTFFIFPYIGIFIIPIDEV